MNYEFPRIVHINQALEAIAGDEDLFYVVAKEGYTVINYKLPCNKTFPPVTDRNTAIRRELRGIKFDSSTGETVSRVLPKFFNAGEREETLLQNIDISKGYDRLEKLDGSMVHPIRINGNQRWCTKMGVTDVAMQVETWLVANHFVEIIEFCNNVMDDGFTPIFEWCSRQNRIVVDHPVDRLVLIAVRHTLDGQYWPYYDMKLAGEAYGIEVVKRDETPIADMLSYVDSIHNLDQDILTEGEVLRFHDGHSVKVKTTDYINLHRTKDKIQKERNLVAVLLDGQLDDLKVFMLPDDLAKAEAYEVRLNQNVNEIVARTFRLINRIRSEDMSRKDFALTSNADALIKQTVFQAWDRNFEVLDIYTEIMKKLRDACEHEQKFLRLKDTVLEGCVW